MPGFASMQRTTVVIAKLAAKTALLAALALASVSGNVPASAAGLTAAAEAPAVTLAVALANNAASATPDPAQADPHRAAATAARADTAARSAAVTWHQAISEASGLRIRKSHPNGRVLATVPLYATMWVSCQQTGWYWVGYHHGNRWIYGWSSAAMIEINPDAAIPQC